MTIPFDFTILGLHINIHLILEYLSFFVAYRYYKYLRNKQNDSIPNTNRLMIILGAAIGALIGSRLFGYLENPIITFSLQNLMLLSNSKTIMGGLFGGLLGVEITKLIIHEKQSSGDLFTLPIIVGIIIGRIGCFLNGVNEFTYGKETDFFMGMNLGDGLLRHPVALYDILFLLLLFLLFKIIMKKGDLENGWIFKIFMLAYFGFRFLIEFIKPNTFYILGLSSIQWLCIMCYIYYSPLIFKKLKHAN